MEIYKIQLKILLEDPRMNPKIQTTKISQLTSLAVHAHLALGHPAAGTHPSLQALSLSPSLLLSSFSSSLGCNQGEGEVAKGI